MRKIINISSFSRSRLNQDPVAGSFYGWHSQYGREVHARLGYEVESWSIDAGVSKGTSYDREGVRYRIFPSQFFIAPGREFSVSLLNALHKEFQSHDVVVHVHDFHNWQTYAIALRFPKARIVAHYHGATRRPLQNLRHPRRLLLTPLFLIEHAFEHWTVRHIRHFFLSNLQQRAYYDRHRFRYTFCPMAPDLQFFRSIDRAEAQRELKLPNDRTIIVNVGGFARPKNLHLLMAAFQKVQAKRPAHVYLIGPTYQPAYRRSVEQYMDTLGIRQDVTVVDFVPKSTLNTYYNAADVLAVTSLQDEGGPTVALEALAVGLPVITTPVGFAPDFALKAESSLHLVHPEPELVAEAILKVAHSSRERAGNVVWTWDDVMKSVQPVYEQLFAA